MKFTPESGLRYLITLEIKKHGGSYQHIPDAIPNKNSLIPREEGGRRWNTMIEKKRQCDGLLVMPHNTIFVEFKANYNKLEPHQKQFGELMESIQKNANRMVWCAIRVKYLKKADVFTIENSKGEIYYKADNVNDVLAWLSRPCTDNSLAEGGDGSS